MNIFKQILHENYLYNNKIEMAIKISIWIISWIGGILILQDKQENSTLGSAYFIFSLSLLMEFIPQIGDKKIFWSKVIHTIFCLFILSIFLLSTYLLFGGTGTEKCYTNMFVITCIVIGYMIINFLSLWLLDDNKIDISPNINISKALEDELKIFEDKLLYGNLGSIYKGEDDE